MAIQTKNNDYFKVDLSKTKVDNKELYITLDVYEGKESRENEKSKLDSINAFIQNAQESLQNEHNQLMLVYRQSVSNPDDISVANNFYQTNLDFRRRYDNYTEKQKEFVEFIVYFFKKSEQPLTLIHLAVWKNLGLQQEWLTSPIIKKGTQTLNVGVYDGKEITTEYLYGKLKSFFRNYQDC